MIIKIEVDEYPQLRHAVSALELEQSRLSKLIRERISSSATADEDAESSALELKLCLDEVETAISLIRNCIEAARHARQREYPPPKALSRKLKAR